MDLCVKFCDSNAYALVIIKIKKDNFFIKIIYTYININIEKVFEIIKLLSILIS